MIKGILKKFDKKCSECGIMDVYCKGMCRSCYQKQYQKSYRKEYRKAHSGNYIYMLKSEDDSLYIGSTTNTHRLDEHLTGHTNLNKTYKDWSELGLTTIKYLDIEREDLDIKEDVARTELYYIEQKLIEKYEPRLNKGTAYNSKVISVARQEELDYILENYISDWEQYELTEYQRDRLGLDLSNKKSLDIGSI